jgi:hypothetical protein
MSQGVGAMEVYPSIWGHWAGGPPGSVEDMHWLDERLKKIFSEAPFRLSDKSGLDALSQLTISSPT